MRIRLKNIGILFIAIGFIVGLSGAFEHEKAQLFNTQINNVDILLKFLFSGVLVLIGTLLIKSRKAILWK